MPHFAIKCRFSGAVRFDGEFGSLRLCLEAAVKTRADLLGANLSGANLSRANLSRADLSGADLSGADLSGADLLGADLLGADLSGANLSRANLSRANLSGANLSGVLIRDGVKLRARGIAKESTRSDGYRFFLLDTQAPSRWRVMAGCRFFTLPEAWKHWNDTRNGEPLGDETDDILVMFEHHAERVERSE